MAVVCRICGFSGHKANACKKRDDKRRKDEALKRGKKK
jgi:hypothetical protein